MLSKTKLNGLIRLIRPKQWIKNGFVLAPLVFTGSITDFTAAKLALLAMLLYCVASSCTYILNDIIDVEADKRHPTKSQKRPIAAGVVELREAWLMLIVCLSILTMALFLFQKIAYVLVGYLLLNLAYTFYLKHQPVLDIFTIAAGFVLRVVAGAVALSVPVSSWMFVTTLCLALYLASIKRRQEILLSNSDGEARSVLKKYNLHLTNKYAEMSSIGALLFYSLFVITSKPNLVFTIPVVLFGIYRYWYIVEKLEGGESPTDVVYSDGQLIVTILFWIGACIYGIKMAG